jgi:hypothetical protein
MALMHHGGMPTAAFHGRSPLSYNYNTGDLNFLPKFLSNSVDHSPDLFEDALKRLAITVPPSITTTHHDGGLPSPLSCTVSNNDHPPPTPTCYPRKFLWERRLFQNAGWTDWEAMQFADNLEAKLGMAR